MDIRKVQQAHSFGIVSYHARIWTMFEQRLESIKQKLTKEKLDGVLISSVSNISYLTGYTNFSEREREAYLIVGRQFKYIITDGRYSESVRKQVTHFQLFERGHKTPIEKLFKNLKKNIKRLGIEEDNLTVSEHKLIKKHFKKTKHFELSKVRSIKSNEEIKKIATACKLGDLAFDFILKQIKVGVTEKQIALELEDFIRQKGAQFSFPAIVAFGKNSSIPHHQIGGDILKKKEGQFILLDFGVKVDDYCSDMTRTIFFGEPSNEQKDTYETVLKAQQKAVDFINSSIQSHKPIKAFQVDKVARDYILSKGFPTIPYSLGHGIGLEVHENPYLSPKSKEVLKEGMVFSIEPGIYLPNFGGVRIEDLFVYENGKLRQLTTSPKTLIEI